MDRRTIYFITESYSANKVFFYNEIKTLSKDYDIVFVSTSGKENVVCDIPNVKLYFYEDTVGKFKKCIYAFKYLFNKKCYEEIRQIIDSDGRHLFKLFRSIEFFSLAEDFYKWFRTNVYDKNIKEAIYYTYWCHYYALALALHKEECDGIKSLITRLHEFDLYDETVDSGRQPFRLIINEKEDRLFFVSQLSLDYYLDRHKIRNKEKAILNRLGTVRVSKSFEKEISEEFLLVSCSTVDSRKRVELIVNALSNIDIPIHWVHFGDGVLFENVKELSKKKLDSKHNIKYDFLGRKKNEEILQFYDDNEVSAFINVSSSEGCPVSIMEAMSFGIPIIATAVGEAELMIESNGIVLNNNPSDIDIANAINQIYDLKTKDEEKYLYMCNKSFEKWNDMFDVERNIACFSDILLKL